MKTVLPATKRPNQCEKHQNVPEKALFASVKSLTSEKSTKNGPKKCFSH